MSGRRLLFVCQNLPYPPDSGPKSRSFHVLRLLGQAFDVAALCFVRGARADSAAAREAAAALGAFARVEVFDIPQAHSPARRLFDHARSVVGRRVYTRYLYRSAPFGRRLAALVAAGRFDVAHLDSLDLSDSLPALAGLPVVCSHHNVESALLARRAAAAPPARRAYLAHQARLMAAEEARWCPRLALNICVSEADSRLLRSVAPDARTAVVPNGVDVAYFQPLPADERAIVSVGGLDWHPNADALRHLAEDILPRLRAAGEAAPLRWVGRAAAADRAWAAGHPGVTLTGHVADIRAAVGGAACFVVPLRVGGGTRVKILDAWAMGKAVVSTSVGCDGLGAVDGEDILVRDDPAGFAAAVRAVLDDADLRARLGRAGRRAAESRFAWDVIGRSMLPLYEGRPGPSRA